MPVISGSCCGTVWYCTPAGPVEVAVGTAPPAGFTGGPWATMGEAVTGCDSGGGGGGGGTPGGPPCDAPMLNNIPDTLYYSMSTSSTVAACANGHSGTMTGADTPYPATPQLYKSWLADDTLFCANAGAPGGGYNSQIKLECVSGRFQMGVFTAFGGCPAGSSGSTPASTGTLSPFSLSFTLPACYFTNATGHETDTVTIVVVE